MNGLDWSEHAAVWLPAKFNSDRDRLLMEGSLKEAVQFVRSKARDQGLVIKTGSHTWAGIELWALTGEA